MRSLERPLIILFVLALLAVACADSDAAMTTAGYGYDLESNSDGVAPPDAPGSPTDEPGGDAAPTAGEKEGLDTDAQEVLATTAADLGRLIVYTASITIEVGDVVAAGEEAQAAIAGLGGVLFGQETTTGDHPRSVLTIKVPPENFQEALRRLGGVGKLLGQSIYADDVTERVVDLESQITTSEASVERLRRFLADATDLETVAGLEAELLARETSLEILRGRLRTLEGQVALATIVLILTEPVPDVPEPSIELIQTGYEGHDGGAGCPGTDELRIDEGSDYTVCITVINKGDTSLIEIEVRDRGLKTDSDDFVLISGSLDAPLPPEGTLIFMYEGVGDPRWAVTDPRVQAAAVDDHGDQIRVEIARSIERLRLQVDADDSLPGFGDGIAAAWRALQRIIAVIVVASGAIIPFLWLPVLAGAAMWFLRRRRTSRTALPDDSE